MMTCNLLLLATACFYFSSSASVSIPSIVTTPPSTSSIPWKTSLVLQCKTQSWPGSPTYFWKKNGNTIYPNSNEKLLFSDSKQTLTLSNATKSQSGEYVCIATENNAYLFETSVALTVIVVEPPAIPAAPSASNITSTSLTLSWAGDSAQYYIVNLNPGTVEVKSTLPSIALTQLQPYTLYTLSVAAYNSAGSRGTSETTSIRTDPGTPSGGPDFTVGLRTSTTLDITWKMPPSYLANDIITGYTLTVLDKDENALVRRLNGSMEGFTVEGLVPMSQYSVNMVFHTRCCTSPPVTKSAYTVREGETVAPTIIPRTESTSSSPTVSIIGAVIGGLVLLVLIAALLVIIVRARRAHEIRKEVWNDGTLDGRDDLVPVSPPPIYCSATGTDEGASSQIASVSNSFKFKSPPPAYRSSAGEEEETASETDRSVSTVSNVDHEQNVSQQYQGRDTWI